MALELALAFSVGVGLLADISWLMANANS